MDLKSGYPFWSVKNGLMGAYPVLDRDIACDVAVIGGGITAALVTDELVRHGHDVVVLERRDIGWGSSAASTALLQYEIDTHLVDLAKRYGERRAVAAYRACEKAIDDLRGLARDVRDVDFRMQSSLYVASSRWHRRALHEEHALRARHGFQVEFLEHGALAERFDVDAPCAILSATAAVVDPYRLAHRLFARSARAGARVFDRTEVASMQATRRGARLDSTGGAVVRAAHVVVAAGYESQRWLDQDVASNHSSYAFISDPLTPAELGWMSDTMVWESARPYLYARSTGDGRVLVGGCDDRVDIAAKRDARVGGKLRKLHKQARKLLPWLELEPAFGWAGTFAETGDGLPFFGAHRQHGPRVLFAMAYGGNGISYSMIGAGLLRALVERRSHPLKGFFGFDRIA